MPTKLWPTGLIGRVGLVLVAAILLELVVSTLVFERAELVSSDDAQAKRIASQLDVAARLLDATAPAQRAGIAKVMSEPELNFAWREASAAPSPAAPDDTRARLLRIKLLSEEPELARRRLALTAASDEFVEGRLALGDGSLVAFRASAPERALPSLYGQIASVALLSGGVLLAALLVVRTLAAPLRMLVRATDAIGRGPAVQLDDARGPREIRRVARAFNAMQARIAKLLADRTAALAAVSHDLRTPIARMRLRAELTGNREEAAAFERDLGEMEAMLDDLNAYLRGDTDPEKPRRTDVAAILQTLVDDATDAGRAATYAGPDHLTANVRALALKRALSNIVNNALTYGERADVSLEVARDAILVSVADEGPGIPEAEQARVLEPFTRGDASRNRAKGGMGLGLAIARAAILREGGTLALANRAEGGLRVTIRLPGQ